jgi:hypothetical protein
MGDPVEYTSISTTWNPSLPELYVPVIRTYFASIEVIVSFCQLLQIPDVLSTIVVQVKLSMDASTLY